VRGACGMPSGDKLLFLISFSSLWRLRPHEMVSWVSVCAYEAAYFHTGISVCSSVSLPSSSPSLNRTRNWLVSANRGICQRHKMDFLLDFGFLWVAGKLPTAAFI